MCTSFDAVVGQYVQWANTEWVKYRCTPKDVQLYRKL